MSSIDIGELVGAADERIGAGMRDVLETSGSMARLEQRQAEAAEPMLFFRLSGGGLDGLSAIQTNAGCVVEGIDDGFEDLIAETF